MKAKLDVYEMAVKEAYRKWQNLKMEIQQTEELVGMTMELKRLEFEQVQTKMEASLVALEDEIKATRLEMAKAYANVDERKSLNDVDGAQVWYQIGREIKERLSELRSNRAGAVKEMRDGAYEGECWKEYNWLIEEEGRLQGELERLKLKAKEAKVKFEKAVIQRKASRKA